MAFLCPVRIRSSGNNGTRKKKQESSAGGGKKRSFLTATVNSLINGDHQLHGDNENENNNDRTAISGASPQQQLGPGRITGSSSIETLVRVGLEKEAGIAPEARMVILHDFTPCVDDELEVRRGSVVSILYRENDWVYVILEQLPNGVVVTEENSKEGFIPHSYCAPYGTPLAEIALCSTNNNAGSKGGGRRGERGGGGGGRMGGGGGGSMSDSETIHQIRNQHHQQQQSHHQTQNHQQFLHHGGNGGGGRGGGGSVGRPHSSFDENSSNNSVTTVPFYKDPSPTRYIALYKFTARDENDVNVERGEILTVLNKDDPEWFYVVRSDGQEGFVPAAFVYPLQAQQQQQHGQHQSQHNNTNQSIPVPTGSGSSQQPTYQQIDNDHEYADAHLQSPGGGLVLLPAGGTGGGSDFSSNQSPNSMSPSVSAVQQQQYGTELVMLYDYKAQAPDDLSVRRGDWVYADLLHQTVEGWLWAFAPKQRKYGFIPKAYARPPAMTSL